MPGGDAPGDVDDEVALMLPSQRPMIFQDSEVDMRDRVGVLETAIDNAVDHGSPPQCAKMLRDTGLPHLDALCRAVVGQPTCTQEACGGPVSFRGNGGAGEAPT